VPGQVDGRRPEDVPGTAERHHRPVVRQAELPPEGMGGEQLDGAAGVLAVVQRQGGVMLAGLVLVEKRGVALLKVGAVAQDDLGDGGGRLGGDDRAAEAVAHQSRQVTGVIEVSVGDDDGVDTRRVDGQWRPVQLAQVLHALEQAAVHQDSLAFGFQEMFGAGDRVRRAQTAQRKFGFPRSTITGGHVLSLPEAARTGSD